MAGLMDILRDMSGLGKNPAGGKEFYPGMSPKEVAESKLIKKSPLQEMAESSKDNEPDYYGKLLDYEGMRTYVYPDHKGNPTTGIGHLIMPGEDFTGYKEEDFEKLFKEKDLPKYLKRTKALVKDFDKYPKSVKEEMVASVFRGGLSGSPKTLELINQGKYKEASVEFLNNNEYREAVQWEIDNNKPHGVVRRMNNLARELANLKRSK